MSLTWCIATAWSKCVLKPTISSLLPSISWCGKWTHLFLDHSLILVWVLKGNMIKLSNIRDSVFFIHIPGLNKQMWNTYKNQNKDWTWHRTPTRILTRSLEKSHILHHLFSTPKKPAPKIQQKLQPNKRGEKIKVLQNNIMLANCPVIFLRKYQPLQRHEYVWQSNECVSRRKSRAWEEKTKRWWYRPGTCLSSMVGFDNTKKSRSCPIKPRVIWVNKQVILLKQLRGARTPPEVSPRNRAGRGRPSSSNLTWRHLERFESIEILLVEWSGTCRIHGT